ncbi:hypothetical protein Tco_1031478 [Tanacetum coccineum]|uniref:Uncharacterized protein n=1 Tax=Tanacetum coccineum TaxID=301880 RepID=A0ABQ5GB32_9ASTR
MVYRYDGLPMHPPSPDYVLGPENLPSPDYMPGPKHPPSPVYVPYVLKPAYPEFMQPEDDVCPNEEQPLPATVSPTADSPGYITESDPEEDPKEDDKDPKEDPADYLADKDDEEEEESSRDDADDEEEDEDEEEEEHLALSDFVLPPAYRTTARMSIRAQTPIPFLSVAEVDRLLAIPTLPPSPLTSYSSPLPQIPSPPLLVLPPLPISPPSLPASPTHLLGYRAATIRLRAESLSTSHPLSLPPPIVLLRTKASMAMMRVVTPSTYCLASRSETTLSGTPPILPIPLPISSPPLLSPSTNYRADVIEVTLPPQKRLCIALGPRYEITESSFVPTARPTRGFREDYGFVGTLDAEIRRDLYREVSYRIIDTWDEMVEAIQEIAPTTLEGVNQRVMDLITTVRQDTNEIYGRLDNAHDDRSLMSGQLNLLRRDRRSHARTTRLMKSEARASREAWV